MRSPLDRLRHAFFFEIFALFLIIPLGSIAFDTSMQDIGVVGVVSAAIAMLWNMVYGWIFDLALRRQSGTTLKSGRVRVLHAVLFEAGLLFVLMPFIAWYLGVSLWQAFVMDVSFSFFYMVYALAFNWTYDRAFPLPEWSRTGSSN